MPYYGSIRALPQPDILIREGDTDPIPWVIRQGDGTPVDLTSVTSIELLLRPIRGTQTVQAYYSSTPAIAAPITITTPAQGAILITPPTSMFLAAGETYRGYFNLYSGSPNPTPRSVPQEYDLLIDVLPKLVAG